MLDFFTKWLDDYLNFERAPKKNIFWLETMRFLCEKLGHPERTCPCFHVAGSKGKGSISAMIAGILAKAGYKVGIYCSPHILDFTERVVSADGPLAEDIYLRSAQELMDCVQAIPLADFPAERPLTWFELVTLFAMLCFRNAGMDYVVWEVGLGGRLDATNVVEPLCCCIGPIELEHTEYLGDTVEKIAAEKGGIIKPLVPVVIFPQTAKVRGVFSRIADERQAPLLFSEDCCTVRDISYERASGSERVFGMTAALDSPLFRRQLHIKSKLLGSFQAWNAAVAALAVKRVLPLIDEDCIEKGISSVSLPGRFEQLSPVSGYPDVPVMILDGAHTANSVRLTMENFRTLYINQSVRPQLLFACASDKDVEDMARCFVGCFSHISVTRPGNVKATDLGRVERAFQSQNLAFTLTADCTAAISDALLRADKAHSPLLVIGSFYLLAEVKKFLKG